MELTKKQPTMNLSSVPFEVRFLSYLNKRIKRAENQEEVQILKDIIRSHKEMYKTTLK